MSQAPVREKRGQGAQAAYKANAEKMPGPSDLAILEPPLPAAERQALTFPPAKAAMMYKIRMSGG